MSVRLVVLDRDGVINHDSKDLIKSPEEWRPVEGSLEAIGLLTGSGFTVAVATNQSGLARGYFSRETLEAIHGKMNAAVTSAGGRIDHIVYCPHGPDDGCDCRKPAPGLLLQLAAHYGVSLRDVPCVGDAQRDLDAAAAVGARGILVRTGKGLNTEASLRESGADAEVFDDLLAAARHLVSEKSD
jgi:D-glycero-D-manno-heptose 1,7-bisphosphate phosphatase